MRLIYHLREKRGGRKLREISELSGVSEPSLSRIERGIELPRDVDVPGLVEAYGCEPTEWYSPAVLLALSEDATS